MKELTNEELMTSVSNGQLDTLKILFERHHVHVFNFLYKMCGDKMLSEDLTQEVFYKIMKYRNSYHHGNFVSWMFTIARNSLKTHFKRNKPHDDIENVSFNLIAENEDNSEEYSQLQLALAKLNTSDRELLVLNRFQELKYNELAEITGSTPGAVKTKVSRALKKLRTIYFKEL
ncbi:sigma-70 family RNA polymerase sigma factor [Maribacter sp. PR1]|uniref:Sigma-70 family RNA polymerase sigma factor n=1 Tax=Maribacter cobaltidurans TaxID=1178778 RepID=A0ABU7IQG7_9FLAO|nr:MULTISPECIES: sigma-70 family RNA polymerase sigma factor [Maribacter]MDC6387746.1 sigma-70 family RNA polymerase sigma factor [Maribacter sp. PR1]MEE1975135.1 sigma-70 family RNA polymerase sigma factor [Maribacter cobaltidurans]